MKRATDLPSDGKNVLQQLKWRGDAALRDLWQITADMRHYANTLERERFIRADADAHE